MAGKRARPGAPRVELGHVAENGISPSLFALVEHGAAKRPGIAKSLRGCVELRFKEDYAPVRISFERDGTRVEDVPAHEKHGAFRPDLVITGSLPDVVQLAAAPTVGGVPKLTDRKGRLALSRVARGRVRIQGSTALARRLLKLLEL